jgi:ATP-binding cassette, subfamily B, bacterial
MKGTRLLYISGIVSIGISTLIMMARPLILTYVLDSILGGEESSLPAWFVRITAWGNWDDIGGRLLYNALLFLLLTAAGGYGMYLKGILTAKAAERTARTIREALYRKLQNAGYRYHVNAETGDIMQRCTSDVETVRMFFANQLTEIGRAVFIFSITMVIMASLDVKMMLISLVLLPVIFFFSFYFFKRVRKTFKTVDEAEGALSNVIQENLTGIRVVRAFARQEFEKQKFEQKNSAYRDGIYSLLRILAYYWSLSDWLSLMQITLVVVIGGYLTAVGSLSIGVYVAFIAYIERILWPIRQMGRILTDMGKMFVARDRIGDILGQACPDEFSDDGTLVPEIRGKIEFRNVSFSYGSRKPVLKGLNFTVEAGKTVAVLGATGSGKSTLVHLITRLYEPTEGEILIDGIPLKSISKKHLRSRVGLVLQEPFLFNRTIRENITIASPQSSDEEVRRTASDAAVHSVIMKFDKQYDTEVGEGGVTLSGGQKQRIAIARVLIRKPPVMIFDDSLSAVDTVTDHLIRHALQRRKERPTTWIISHRITTLSEADMIIVLEHGTVTAIGSHEQLIAREGLYRRIWELQSAGSEAADNLETAPAGGTV